MSIIFYHKVDTFEGVSITSVTVSGEDSRSSASLLEMYRVLASGFEIEINNNFRLVGRAVRLWSSGVEWNCGCDM